MCSYNNILIVCLLLGASSARTTNKDSIGFPESEENPNLRNKEDRKPVYIPAMCPSNELYYPGDQKDDWICDCRPAHLYHPGSDLCWPAYRQGPCKPGEYLVLPPNSVIPVCEKNPCNTDMYVPWNSQCERLGSSKPCDSSFPATSALEVNATTLEINCESISVASRFREPKPATVTIVECPPGCKRSVIKKCKPTYG